MVSIPFFSTFFAVIFKEFFRGYPVDCHAIPFSIGQHVLCHGALVAGIIELAVSLHSFSAIIVCTQWSPIHCDGLSDRENCPYT